MPENKKAGGTGFFGSYCGNALSVLCQSLDTLGAKSLADELVALFHLHDLQIRIELTPSRSHGETAGITELRLLATRCTNRHERTP